MNIVSIPYHTFPSIGYAINASQSGRTSLPVSSSTYIYSHFKHVSGVPAPEGVRGVNINKLKILDTLIEQLSRMKKEPDAALYGDEQTEEDRINTMIERYQGQIRLVQETNAAFPYRPAAPDAGMVFSLTA